MKKFLFGTEKSTDEYTLPEVFALKNIFDKAAEETISDEQVRRLCAPIIKMIKEGKFDSSDTSCVPEPKQNVKAPMSTGGRCAISVKAKLPKQQPKKHAS